ncbi:MAG: polymer-forming cytoskeletal protein [Cocleimonas sp.]
MFSSKKKQNELLRAKINTLIGEGTEVEGIVKFTGGLHVVGTINGGAVSKNEDSLLIVSENALVKGDVVVKHLIVNGQIDGEIYVDGKVELFDKARINGDIHYKILELPVGAEVNGKLIRIDEEK